MAIPVFETGSEQKEGSDTTSSTITAPTGIADDDILVIHAAFDGDAGTVTPPSGFTLINFAESSGSGRQETYAWWKRASSESGNYAVSWVTSQRVIFYMTRISGALTGSDPIDDPDVDNVGSSTSTTSLGFTTAEANELAVSVHGADGPSATVDGGYEAGWNGRNADEASTNAGSPCGAVQDKDFASASATGNAIWTILATEKWACFQYAIKEATGAPPARTIFEFIVNPSAMI